ncbi:adenylylsulfate kinase family protein [Hibiscus syriacus]|uniref:Adenylylsulfate kinase family protein n=1 Tax=Hibiscus syriacus TaxID=106335 RepID=A0A6A2WUN0_HIBSY|nr:adenylylsulfate kinase family protein [Hibiscus syriacus]
MEKDERNQRTSKTIDSELFLQWGNRKGLRCVRVKDPQKISHKSNAIVRRRITCRLFCKDSSPSSRSNHRLTRNSEAAILRSTTTEHQKNSSLEKEDRYYTTRGLAVSLMDDNGKVAVDCSNGDHNKALV